MSDSAHYSTRYSSHISAATRCEDPRPHWAPPFFEVQNAARLLDYLCLVLCTTIQGNWIGSFFVYRVDFTALKGRRNKINVDINVQLALQLCDLVFEPFPGRNNWLKCDTWLWKIWCVYIPVYSACMLERESTWTFKDMYNCEKGTLTVDQNTSLKGYCERLWNCYWLVYRKVRSGKDLWCSGTCLAVDSSATLMSRGDTEAVYITAHHFHCCDLWLDNRCWTSTPQRCRRWWVLSLSVALLHVLPGCWRVHFFRSWTLSLSP